MTLDMLLELDTFEVNVSGDWANYVWPEYDGRKRTLAWNRAECRFREGKQQMLGALVNRVLREEGVI